MRSHDSVKEIASFLESGEMIKKISPKFSEMSMDIQEVYKNCNDPMFVAVLMYKLAEEREKTNKILEKIFDKYDEIMLKLKTEQISPLGEALTPNTPTHTPQSTQILPEQDQMIMHLVHTRGQLTAAEVKTELGYKGVNAASQRLNKLFKDGHLKKVQSGRKVLYLARTI